VPADWFEPVTLDGKHVRLEPLTPAHTGELRQTGSDPEIWRWMPARPPATAEAMAAIVDTALTEQARGERMPFAIRDRTSGVAVGSSSYLDVVSAHRRLEIGWTWLGRDWWRTPANTEAKLLLLSHAFDTLGATRVALKTDAANVRSQAAIERIGGVREGTLRAHLIRPDGTRRDTVYFSILADEWPAARERLTARLQR